MREKDDSEAPAWYSAEEASAWTCGYNQALAAERERCELEALRERDSLNGKQDVRVRAACQRIANAIQGGAS